MKMIKELEGKYLINSIETLRMVYKKKKKRFFALIRFGVPCE